MDTNYVLGLLVNGEILHLSSEDRRRHIYIIGKTGTGKSTLLKNLMLADLQSGRGFALLDPHGDLAQEIVDATPVLRTNDIIYLDPSDIANPFGFNVLEAAAPDERPLRASHVVSAFKNIWWDSWGVNLEYIFSNGLRLLLENEGTTLAQLPRLLTDNSYRTFLLGQCADGYVRHFWEEEFGGKSDKQKAEELRSTQNKVGQFTSNPVLRNIIGQPKSTINIPEIMNTGKILVVNLSKGALGKEPSHILGALMTTTFAQAAEARVHIPEEDRRDFTLYVDEFQNFATTSFADILSEARKWRLSLVLAHQYLGQVPPALLEAVQGNTGTIIAFRVGANDAEDIAKELGRNDPTEFTNTPTGEAWVKVLRNGAPTDAHHLRTLPAELSKGRLDTVVSRTRARHTRPRARVEHHIASFFRSRRGR